MKEYWVNVYDQSIRPLYEFSAQHRTPIDAIHCAYANATYCKEKLLYRIHVKMKEPKPKFSDMCNYVLPARINWMD